MRMILASASPRRQELLRLIAEEFEIIVSAVDETLDGDWLPEAAVEELARRKALAVSAANPDALVIGSDTVVAVDGEILGKPMDEADAANMLRRLSGRSHTVYTGVALADADGCYSFVEHTDVAFISLSEEQIAAYIASGEPMDKAGAYGIQERGALFVSGIQGDFYTVMGLPVCRLAQEIAQRIKITDKM